MSRRNSGSVFIVTLAVLAGLVSIVGVVSSSHQESLRATTNRMQRERARLMVDAGIQRAIATIQEIDVSKAAKLSDDWATLGDSGSTLFNVGFDSFRIQIQDSGSKINLNSADQDTLKLLPLSPEQIDCLMDWRESNQSERSQGAKDPYYNALQKGYATKLQPFGSIDELLQVKGFTPSTLYSTTPGSGLSDLLTIDSTSADQGPLKSPKVDVNSVSVQQLVGMGIQPDQANAIIGSRGSYKKISDILNLPNMTKVAAHVILDNLTVGGATQQNGLINLNTASEQVLSAVPKLDSDIVSAIRERQSDGFRSLGDLVDVPGLEMTKLVQVVDRFCVGSRSFEVRVIGTAGFTQVAYEATLTLGDKAQVQIKRLQPITFPDASTRWGWPNTPTRQVAVGESPQ